MIWKIIIPFIGLGVLIGLALLYFNRKDRETPTQKFCDKYVFNVNDYPKIDDINEVYSSLEIGELEVKDNEKKEI